MSRTAIVYPHPRSLQTLPKHLHHVITHHPLLRITAAAIDYGRFWHHCLGSRPVKGHCGSERQELELRGAIGYDTGISGPQEYGQLSLFEWSRLFRVGQQLKLWCCQNRLLQPNHQSPAHQHYSPQLYSSGEHQICFLLTTQCDVEQIRLFAMSFGRPCSILQCFPVVENHCKVQRSPKSDTFCVETQILVLTRLSPLVLHTFCLCLSPNRPSEVFEDTLGGRQQSRELQEM